MTSGLQKQIFSLYRKCLRAAYKKEPEVVRNDAVSFVRSEFRSGATQIKKTDFRTIEYMIRNGEKMLKMYSKSATVRFSKIDPTL